MFFTKVSYLSINLSRVDKIMDKYKINYIFNSEKDLNDIFIKVLNKEIKKYIEMIYQNPKHQKGGSEYK